MENNDSMNEKASDGDVYPVEPYYHPLHRIPRKCFDFLASAKLAMFLLVIILVCSITGVTVVRDKQAWELIFSTFWFNSLLVLLIINVSCCFFGRIWGRRVTLISLGMILFHLSFVSMFLGIVYNSLFYFRANVVLTEGETLPCNDYNSYSDIYMGRLFNISRASGSLSLIKLHTDYKVDGVNKRVAYELVAGKPDDYIRDLIYVTRHVNYKGFKYFPDSEGYSLLTVLQDKSGKELYGAYIPLQSLPTQNNSFLYTIGTRKEPTTMSFPQPPAMPLFDLNLSYKNDPKKERAGEAYFQIWPLSSAKLQDAKPIKEGKADIGGFFEIDNYKLSVEGVYYWTKIAVRYEPGQPVILTSLWVGLAGLILTTSARMFRKKAR